MDCEHVRNSLSDYLDGMLEGREREDLDRHLASCTACRRAKEEMASVVEKLRLLGGEAAPAEAVERVRMRLERLYAGDGEDTAEERRFPFGMMLFIRAAAVFFLVFLVGYFWYATRVEYREVEYVKKKKKEDAGGGPKVGKAEAPAGLAPERREEALSKAPSPASPTERMKGKEDPGAVGNAGKSGIAAGGVKAKAYRERMPLEKEAEDVKITAEKKEAEKDAAGFSGKRKPPALCAVPRAAEPSAGAAAGRNLLLADKARRSRRGERTRKALKAAVPPYVERYRVACTDVRRVERRLLRMLHSLSMGEAWEAAEKKKGTELGTMGGGRDILAEPARKSAHVQERLQAGGEFSAEAETLSVEAERGKEREVSSDKTTAVGKAGWSVAVRGNECTVTLSRTAYEKLLPALRRMGAVRLGEKRKHAAAFREVREGEVPAAAPGKALTAEDTVKAEEKGDVRAAAERMKREKEGYVIIIFKITGD